MLENVTQNNVSIWGGQLAASDLAQYLNQWDWAHLDMPWRIWEWASDMTFEHQAETPTLANTGLRRLEWLERMRFFGLSGDLELRRDGAHFRWRFVGQPGVLVPQCATAHDYWHTYPHRALTPVQRQGLLWGKEVQDLQGLPQGVWQEDRVGYARLVYPKMQGDARVVLHYTEYLYGDNVEVVWWTGLERWEGQNG